MKLNQFKLLLACSLFFVACDSEEPVTNAGEMPGGEMMAGMMMAGMMMAGDMPAGEMPAGEMPAGEMPAGEMPAGEMPAGMMMGGTMTGICNEVVEIGATCSVSNDCCARGSFCFGEGTSDEGECVQRCEIDAEGDSVGCGEREICFETGEEADEEGVLPGYCFRGQDCTPGNEELACGEGEFHCFSFQNISLCIGDLAMVREEAPELIVGEGQPCNPFGDEENGIEPTFCEPGFACESNGSVRVCRAACDTDMDCGEGYECLDYTERLDGVTYKYCSPTCNLAAPDCGETGACVLTDILNNVAFGTCQEVAPEQIRALGERCDPYTDTEAPSYCEAGLSCEFDGYGYLCSAICEDNAGCVEGQTCFSAATRYENEAFQYNYCTTPCDPLSQDCAAEDAICVFAGVIEGAPFGTCITDATDGEQQNTDACVPSGADYDYWGDCDASNVCFINEDGETGTCGSFCTSDRPEYCTGADQLCVDSSIEGLGLCQTNCNLDTNEGCNDGESCIFAFNEGLTADGSLRPVGFCYENDRIAEVGLEEPCVIGQLQFNEDPPFDFWYLNNCEPNHICVDLMDPQNNPAPICLKSCSVEAQTGCPDGYVCEQFWTAFDNGICLPAQ